ncbi:MAG: serine hydroxymethyltransferase [Alphaproteobacteria bacterium]
MSRTDSTSGAEHLSTHLADFDPEVAAIVRAELLRQQDSIDLIASENLVGRAVLEVQGSVLANKTIEGYPGRRYHGGAQHADALEGLAIERAKRLFDCRFANVQPHSGSQANQVVFLALLAPGDTSLSMSLATGGHLSHGAPVNMSGRWFNAVQYGVRRQDGLIDYEEAERLGRLHRPKLIIAGGSSYPRAIDFARLRALADEVGATLLADIAHFSGLVAAGITPSPFPHAHVVTVTTYKNLRGPRGGLVLANDPDLARRIDSALFPGLQGSAHVHAIAAKAVALGEALRPEFRTYARAVLENARSLAAALAEHGLAIVTGGTDMPLALVDLRPKGLTGDRAAATLERAGITCNKNLIPFDPEKPGVTSGLRLGASAATSRGLGPAEFRLVGELIAHAFDGLAAGDGSAAESRVRERVSELCRRFPIYPDL